MTELEIARRDAVARLCRAQATGLLSVEAFEERYVLMRDANSVSTLEALMADLVEEDYQTFLPAPVETESGSYGMATAGYMTPGPVAPARALRIPAVLGSAVRAGTWTVPEELEVLVTLGEVKLDFRDAAFTTDTVVINVSVLFGSLKIIVPPGTQIENECSELLSSSAHPRGRVGAQANGLLVILRGRVRFGEISIKERVPTGEEPHRFQPFIRSLLGKPDR